MNEETTRTPCPTHFLTDEPSDTDELGGAHKRIADAIFDTITDPDSKGLTIGLEGKWGSGKSTVIRFLEKKLAIKKIPLFTFNAWSHQGDPLRFSFLISLLNSLERDGYLIPKEKNKIKNNLLTTKSSTSLSWPSILSFFFLLFVTVGSSLLQASNEQTYHWFFQGRNIVWIGFVGLVLTVLWSWRFKKPLNIESSTLHPETTNEQSHEPTANRLIEVFLNQIVATLQMKNNDFKLVIVFDDLDRLEPNEFLEAWSSVRLFVDRASKEMYPGPAFTDVNKKSIWDKIWVIVPFSKDGLEKMFYIENPNNHKDETQTSKTMINGFIDKNIQVLLHIPESTTLNWRRVLKLYLEKAFPQHKKEADDVVNLYSVFTQEKDVLHKKLLTPRSMKRFVNDVCAIHILWCKNNYQLIELAFYVTLLWKHEKKSGVRGCILSPIDFLDKRYCHLLKDEERLRTIASSLFFNLPKDDALELLIEQPLSEALIKRDVKKFDEIVTIQLFKEIFEKTLLPRWLHNWSDGFADQFCNAVLTIFDSEYFFNSVEDSNLMKKLFHDYASLRNDWMNFDEDKAKSLIKLIGFCNSLPLTTKIVDSVQKQTLGTSQYEDHVKGIVDLNRFMLEFDPSLVRPLKIPSDVYAIFTFLNTLAIADTEQKLWSKVDFDESMKPHMFDIFVDAIDKGKFDETHFNVLYVLSKNANLFNIEALLQVITRELQTKQHKPTELQRYLSVYWEIVQSNKMLIQIADEKSLFASQLTQNIALSAHDGNISFLSFLYATAIWINISIEINIVFPNAEDYFSFTTKHLFENKSQYSEVFTLIAVIFIKHNKEDVLNERLVSVADTEKPFIQAVIDEVDRLRHEKQENAQPKTEVLTENVI